MSADGPTIIAAPNVQKIPITHFGASRPALCEIDLHGLGNWRGNCDPEATNYDQLPTKPTSASYSAIAFAISR